MDLGVATFIGEGAIGPAALAKALEERGFDALFVAEHTHMPASMPPGPNSLPWYYYRSLDPFLALAIAAEASDRLVLGTSICLVIQRDPITLAKEVASLDQLSGGRFELGVGAGWSTEEMANHGTDPAHRTAVLRERVLAMKEIWTHETAEYHGAYVNFSSLYQWPKPVQQPHPPVLIGGGGPTVIDRVLAYGDGWIPMANDLEAIAPRVAELRKRAADAGRHGLTVTACAVPATREAFERAAEIGVDRVLVSIDAAGPDETCAQLDAIAANRV
jgi:probable F420-dependent oxidoreductase